MQWNTLQHTHTHANAHYTHTTHTHMNIGGSCNPVQHFWCTHKHTHTYTHTPTRTHECYHNLRRVCTHTHTHLYENNSIDVSSLWLYAWQSKQMQHPVTRSKMGTRHALLAVLCYSVPHVDASQEIKTFGDCTFYRDDAGGRCCSSHENKLGYTTQIWYIVTCGGLVTMYICVHIFICLFIYIFQYIYAHTEYQYIYKHLYIYAIYTYERRQGIDIYINIYTYMLIYTCAHAYT